MPIERIEVYLDNVAEPVQVLKQPPFKVSYDTRSLPDGEHSLRVETYYANGSKEIKEIPFKVANTPGVLVQGLDEGKEVSGNLDVTLRVADPDIKPTRERIPALALASTLALLLLVIWGFFAINKPLGNGILDEVAKPATGEGGEGAAMGGVDQALLTKGGEVFGTAGCAGCHGANGEGGVGPKLVGDDKLKDAKHIVQVVTKGQGTMPAIGANFSDQELAAVATYLRNSWGNKFGGVSVEEAKAAR